MHEHFEVRVVVEQIGGRTVHVRTADAGRVWIKPIGGLDGDGEFAVSIDVLADAMRYVEDHNSRGEE